MIHKLDLQLAEKILQKARKSPRKRAIHCFHDPHDTLQRMINAGLSDSYVRPHKHENPDKLEIFYIVKGIAAIVIFGDDGKITESVTLDENGPVKVAEIPPRIWHCFVIISSEAVLYEVIEGKYDQETHKKFASWAPEEDSEESKKYPDDLKKKISSL